MILLDTHAWVWWVSDSGMLSEKAEEEIGREAREGQLWVSSISVWEVALLADRGRIELTMDVADWVSHSEMLPFLRFIPVNNGIAIRAVRLPGDFHSDPADRIIVATALSLNVALVSKDERIRSYPHVDTLW